MKAISKSKTAIALLVIGAAACALFATGCNTTVGQDVANRMDALEQRVKALEDTAITKFEEGDYADKTYSDAEAYADYARYLADVEKRVEDASTAAEAASVPADADEKARAYDKAVIPLENLEDELGHLKDAYVAANANGMVSDDELVQLNGQADVIYANIDNAISQVKTNFGISD